MVDGAKMINKKDEKDFFPNIEIISKNKNRKEFGTYPKHELITDEEKKELLKIYRAKEIHLPKMLASDPIARYFGARKGQIFKITRGSESSGDYIYYRIVV